MTARADSRINFKAIDNVSGVVEKISSKFPKLTKVAKRSSKAFDRIDKSSSKLRNNLGRLGGGMKSVGGAMTAGLTLPIVAFGAKAFEVSRVFDQSMNKVKALTGANEMQLKSLRVEAKKLGSTTSFSASQAADAMAFFGQAGWDTNEILKATAPTLALAAASGTDLANTADIMSNVMGGFNLEASEAARVSDVLAKATAKGNINMAMIGESMKDAAPVAQKYGASIEEVSALTAKLGDAGIQGSKAGTTLKNMFLNLSAPTSKIKKIMGSLGVQTVDPVTGKMRKMTDILVDMNKAFKAKGLSDSKRLAVLDAVFGKRAIAGAGVLLNAVEMLDPATGKVVNTVKVLEKGLIGAEGTAKRMEKTMLDGLPGAVATLKSAFEGMMIAIMDSGLSDFLVVIINKISSFFQWVSSLNPTLLKWGAIIAGIVAVAGPLILGLGVLISMLPMLITGFNTLMVALGVIKGAFAFMLAPMALIAKIMPMIAFGAKIIAGAFALLLSPIGMAVAGITALINLVARWDTISKAFKKDGIIGGVKSFFGFGGSDDDSPAQVTGSKAVSPQGQETGSKELTRKNFEFIQRKQQASVDVKFSNMPKETQVMSEDREGMLNIDTGMMGGI